MSSRSNSHASIDGHDEPLLPFGNGFDKPRGYFRLPGRFGSRFPARVRNIFTRTFIKRVLILATAILLILAIALYNQKPVSLSGVVVAHHRHQDGQSQPPGDHNLESEAGEEKTLENEGPALVQQPLPAETADAPAPARTTESAIVVVVPGAGLNTSPEEHERPPAGLHHDGHGGPDVHEDDLGHDGHDGDAEYPYPVQSDGDGSSQGDDGAATSSDHGDQASDDDEDDDDDDDKLSPQDLEAKKAFQEDLKGMPWLRFKHLNGYFHGLKTLVPASQRVAEYPNPTKSVPASEPPTNTPLPTPAPFDPYDDPSSSDAVPCYLDSNETIPAPDIYAYEGLPPHYPDPVLGSYEILGIRDDVCFDRFGRYGPYGLGYSKSKGGSDVGEDTESAGSEYVWEKTGQIDYSDMNWGDAQDRCVDSNSHRLRAVDSETGKLEKTKSKKSRTAVVIRAYTDFKWTDHVILNFRAMINELSLRSGGEYTVHLLVQVRDVDLPVWADEVTVQRLLDANVPPEFHGIVSLWSEPQMRLYYPGQFAEPYSNPSGRDLHGVYRGGHFPLQIFAMEHPEYEHFWNWEMDMRYVGNYYELFDRLGKWGEDQPRPLIWERSARYYIPSHHGSWQNFSDATAEQTAQSGIPSPFGPLKFSGRKSLRFEAHGESVLPDDCDVHTDRAHCGVGEPADLITLNPIFDTEQSGWFFGLDATGYGNEPPPRRASIITASRLSRRLLMAMHEEVWRHHHTMFPEMFPASVALHHGFKGVFGPHPIYLDRLWTPQGEAVDAAFNGGEYHSTSGHGSPFDLGNEHNHKGTSWYYNSEFSGMVWRRWLGYAQHDGRGKYGGRAGEGQLRGGKDEEESDVSTGRLCLRSMLVHPIKREHPSE